MADEKDNTHQEQPDKSGQPDTPISNNRDEIKEEQKNLAQKSENENTKCNSLQPFIVKIEKSKGWSKQEKIAAFAVGLNFIAIAISSISVSQAIRMANNSDSTFSLNIRNNVEASKRFEMENRPLVQPVDFKMQVEVGKPVILSFNITNLGKLPGKVLTGKMGLCYGLNLPEDSVDRIVKPLDYVFYTAIGSNIVIPSKILGMDMTSERYEYYKKEVTSFYFVGEIVYEAFISKTKYVSRFMYRINTIPGLRVVGMRFEDKEL